MRISTHASPSSIAPTSPTKTCRDLKIVLDPVAQTSHFRDRHVLKIAECASLINPPSARNRRFGDVGNPHASPSNGLQDRCSIPQNTGMLTMRELD